MAEVLADGQEVGEDLGGMELVGQAVPHRHAGIFGQRLDDFLAVAAVLDAVVHPAQHPRGVCDGFLFADLRAAGVQIGHAHAQIVGGHLEAAAGARAGLFKDQRDVFAAQRVVGHARLFACLQLRRKIQQRADLLRRIIDELQKAPSLECHGIGLHCFNDGKHYI